MNEASVEILNVDSKEKTNSFSNVMYFTIKRVFDFIMSLVSLIVLSPVFLLIIIAIRIDSKGKAIFKQKRIGKNGKPIYIYKFRSMILNAEDELERLMREDSKIREEYKVNKKLKNDPRVTKLGNMLRKSSLDELPQLLNILKGDMSFVGPRPYLYREMEDMQPYYERIIEMQPGLTGLWQVSGRSDVSFAHRLKLDNRYYHIRNLKTDIKILFMTFKVVIIRKGAK